MNNKQLYFVNHDNSGINKLINEMINIFVSVISL